MFSKKRILDASVMLFCDDVIDEVELLAIYEATTKRVQHPYKKYERIEYVLDEMSPVEFQTEFRFGISELPLLVEALKIPEKFVCSRHSVTTPPATCLATFALALREKKKKPYRR